jgi:hypothetical protein
MIDEALVLSDFAKSVSCPASQMMRGFVQEK